MINTAVQNKTEESIRKSITGDKKLMQSIMMFCSTDAAVNQRVEAYVKSFAATTMLEESALKEGSTSKYRKLFTAGSAGLTEANLAGTTLMDAVIRSQVSSIAGIFAKEVSVDSPNVLLQFIDAENLLDQSVQIPNLGMETNLTDDGYSVDLSAMVNGVLTEFDSTSGIKLVPNTVRISVVAPGNIMTVITDDGQGNLLAPAGFLAAGAVVNYASGAVTLKFAAAPVANTTIKLKATQDRPGETALDSLTGIVKNFQVTTSPNIIPVTRNVLAEHLMQRQGVVDIKGYYTNLIESTYTKKINMKVVNALMAGLSGDIYTGDLSAYSLATSRYDAFIRQFKAIIADAATELAHQTYKGGSISAILAGKNIGALFTYLNTNEGWIPNTELFYFKDVLGWYNEIPVVRWESNVDDAYVLEDNAMILTHKTPGGELAAVVRPIFLTPTDIAEVFNFENPLQVKSGLFSVDGAAPTSSKLSLKVVINLPAEQFLVKN